MKTFTDAEVAEWIGNQWGDSRWDFAVMKGDDGQRWLFGTRCSIIFPMFSVDSCPYDSLDAGFWAFFKTPGWKTVERMAGCGETSDKATITKFNRAAEDIRKNRV